MKNKEITTKVLKFENGDIILAVDNEGYHHVKTSENEIFAYSANEMIEIYNFNPNE